MVIEEFGCVVVLGLFVLIVIVLVVVVKEGIDD